MAMTQHYLCGELSLLLARLQATSGDAAAATVARLRYEAETSRPRALGSVVVRALNLVDDLCWDSLMRGDVEAFSRQAVVGADLRSFGTCAGLLGDA
jgi:hypothetical protein